MSHHHEKSTFLSFKPYFKKNSLISHRPGVLFHFIHAVLRVILFNLIFSSSLCISWILLRHRGNMMVSSTFLKPRIHHCSKCVFHAMDLLACVSWKWNLIVSLPLLPVEGTPDQFKYLTCSVSHFLLSLLCIDIIANFKVSSTSVDICNSAQYFDF